MFKNRALILAKAESSYGVDPIPTTAANAILTDLPEVDVVMKKLDRLNVKAFFGNRPAINIGEAIKISFSTEVKGSGDVDSGHASGDRRPVRRVRDAGNRNPYDRAGRLHPAGRHRRAVDHDLLLAARHSVRRHGLPRHLVPRREGRGVRQDQVGVPGALRRSGGPYDPHGRRVQRLHPARA